MGRPKALLKVGGIALLTRVCDSLSGVVSRIIVVSAPGQDLPKLESGVEIVEDDISHSGPLAGLSRGYEALERTDGHTFVVGCDYPFLTKPFLIGLLAKVGDADVAVVASDRPQPLGAWYRTSVLDLASDLIVKGEKRLSRLLSDLSVREVEEEELAGHDPGKATFSINTPDELEQAESIVR
jgi:molybdopterin-guanine dinucleotide biosynthesis protein A